VFTIIAGQICILNTFSNPSKTVLVKIVRNQIGTQNMKRLYSANSTEHSTKNKRFNSLSQDRGESVRGFECSNELPVSIKYGEFLD
jgi:hypothetical protein